ncbi:Lectin-Abr-1 [Trichostrongylus colubriformis]|uniref:Lectin-Abr-1 n=1 Tax=Trichostrongylus colubriformis TaxID=6319 RepID=A0AAN8FLB3_TRICO
MFLSTALIPIILSTCVDAKWIKFGQYEYKDFRGRYKQEEAETRCNDHGGQLASIHSKAENDFLFRKYYGRGYLWIGLVRDGNKWFWTDGTPANYIFWGRGRPRRNHGYCAWGFESNPYGSWSDVHCDKHVIGFICKRKAF